jgi:mRNA interferase MazF
VLVLTRNQVLDVRALVTVAEITTSMRNLAAEVPIDLTQRGLDGESAVNCDGLHTVPQTMLTEFVGVASEATMLRVCAAVSYALGC